VSPFVTILGMTMQSDSDPVHRFSDEYLRMGEVELLRLAAAYDSLVVPAQDALRGEFSRRGMEPPLIEEPEAVTSQPLVTVRRYRDLSEAIVARSTLESAGIFCFLQDENFLRLDWGAAIALGGLRLQVRPEDMWAAEELLNQPIPESIEYESRAQYLQPHCPRCGSIEIAFQGSDRSAALVSTLVLAVPLPFGDKSWRCQACGCRWADDESESSAEEN
jgi:hypothetical protein